jgi:hypothetical protein
MQADQPGKTLTVSFGKNCKNADAYWDLMQIMTGNAREKFTVCKNYQTGYSSCKI